jgi:poly(3-hydroxybutyrate) depolymerase
MGKSFSKLLSAAMITALCGTASANLTGTVTSTDGKAIEGADVTLLKRNKSTTTDSQGKFSFDQLTKMIEASRSAGSFSLTNGVLNFSQNGSSPVQVKIFDLVGNQVFAQTLQGSGSMDLNSVIESQGTYLARVKLGSAQETIRFNARGNYSGSLKQDRKALFRLNNNMDTLRIVKEGFDTLKMYLANLDTNLTIKLSAVSSGGQNEETFAFGYALGNAPRPSKGCGKNSSINSIGTVENGQKFQINVGGKNRIFFLTLPKNYDNSKPHKVLIANHCMGSKAEDFVHHSPDYDHPTPYYGQQNLDKNGDYIFAAPQGNDNGTWNGQEDHDFVNQMITTIQDNYCVDTTRVFATGFSFGAMFTNSLAQHMQDRLRAVAVYATADYNIWLPQNTGKPIAWMGVHGKNDGVCNYDRAKTSALPRILKNNGKAGADGKFTDASSEKPTEINGNTGHVCYDFKTVDERFPVKWCSWPGGHQWTAHDNGSMSVGAGWQETWVPEEVHKFFEQF